MLDNINLIYAVLSFTITLILMFVISMYLYSKLVKKAQKRFKIQN